MAKKTDRKNDDLVEIRLFKDNGKYKDDMYVSVNGKRYQIQRGVTVKVPREVKVILERSLDQDTQTANMISGLEDEYLQKARQLN